MIPRFTMRTVALLGSTGSVGTSALEVLDELHDSHRPVALVARGDARGIIEQARKYRPLVVGLFDRQAASAVEDALRGESIRVISGEDAAVDALRETRPQIVLAAITGAAGLASSLEAVRMGALLALANKEALVMAGHLLTRFARESGAKIVPVDSEHSAIFQALNGAAPTDVRRLFLTASGGPLVDLAKERFAAVTAKEALNHPTWKMGPKITIDSATLMNKALEIVEARWLFDVPAESIEVVIHRQSIVHSMVEFVDGSILGQLGVPSMTVPIRYALAWPQRARTRSNYFDLKRFSNLTFESPDRDRFPALALGERAARELGIAGTVLNAANEIAVARFLEGKTAFDRIPSTVARVLDGAEQVSDPSLAQILAADRWARTEAERCLTL